MQRLRLRKSYNTSIILTVNNFSCQNYILTSNQNKNPVFLTENYFGYLNLLTLDLILSSLS